MITSTARPWLIRASLLGVIAFAMPLKIWLAADERTRTGAETTGAAFKDSAEVLLSDARLPSEAKVRKAVESIYDLSLPGLDVRTPANSLANHSPSIAALDDGSLAMSWFGGSREGARDVQIFFSRFDGSNWSAARALMGTDQLMKQTGRYLTKLGNPMLYFDANRLHCWFVSVSLGGWGGARLNHMSSSDGGETWSQPRLLITSPFLNVSTLVRSTALPASTPVVLGDAGPRLSIVPRETLIPAYFELSHKYPVMLRVDGNSQLLDRYPFGGKTGLLQPSVVRTTMLNKTENTNSSAVPSATAPVKDQATEILIAFFRRGHAVSEERVFTSHSLDQGQTWSDAQATGIPNDDASVAAWADRSNIWLIANPELKSRRSIASYKLTDAWPYSSQLPPAQHLDQVPASLPGHQEFSYPSLARTRDGRLHLVYTADGRKSIRHRIWAPQPLTNIPNGQKP